MKKAIIIILALVLAASLAACTTSPKGEATKAGTASTQDDPSSERINTASDTDEPADAIGGWGGDDLELRYSGPMSDLGLISEIAGIHETDQYVKEIVEPNKWEVGREYPAVYSAIEYFSIPEDTFREANNAAMEYNNKHGLEYYNYSEEQIAALYCGDKDEMNRRLMRPYSFYTGERVLSADETLRLDVDGIVGFGIDLDELSEYCERLRAEVPNHPDSDIEWYENKIDEMAGKIEEARARTE